MLTLERYREALVIGLVLIFMGLAIYTLLGLAWAFKTAVEAPHRLLHPSSRVETHRPAM